VQPFGTKVGKGTIIGDFVYMGKGVKVGRDCTIYPQVYLGDGVVVGDNTVLHPGVKVYHECVIGSNCIIHANAVIGADGFGFAPRPDGTYKKIPQLGNVVIEDDVEIGANTTVDRATMGSTIVHKGVKVDNLCQLAHNTEIGENTAMAAQTGIAGSTHIGESCIIAGQVGISGHITIAPHSTIGPQSGIMGSIKRPGQTVMGSPAFDYPAYMRASVKFKQSGQK
ncbi:MAG: UDP-3-O-(3-hydroxymyristoyl)glucosamine N-acyltransferase, partial [Bacteroidales bacterium]|nr:UDP-3-O-(3-hydroxymyristoyl)glucosamine N-acyltransferase [Bacteroidales bacterium]